MTTASLPTRVDHLVIGAGFAGIATAIALDEDGEHDYAVLEKADDIGGTWRANSYPGAACDVPSHLYSYSFAPNPDWSRNFSHQAEILDYTRRVARERGILDRIHVGTEVLDTRWDDEAAEWIVETSRGTVRASFLVSGAGGLSEPRLPEIEGIDSFEGDLFHTARWDHSVDLTGKRVAVIGTGASAIQVVPSIQPVVGHLDLYQRTAPWVIPRTERAYTRAERAVLRKVPALTKVYREAIYWGRETYVPAFARFHRLATPARMLALRNLSTGVADPTLRARLTPTFELGCKRVLISSTYYPAVSAPNVELVTDRILRVTPTGVVSAGPDGEEVERPVDVIVVATGFHTTDHPIAEVIHGRDGRSLAEVWAETGMAAYKGTTVHGFPNFFMLVGPNVTLGHSSMVFMIEAQVRYLTSAVATMRVNRLATVEPRAGAQERWNADLQERMQRTVWNTGGCASWYLDEHGRNTILWPRHTFTFRRLLAHFDLGAYDVSAARPSDVPIQEATR